MENVNSNINVINNPRILEQIFVQNAYKEFAETLTDPSDSIVGELTNEYINFTGNNSIAPISRTRDRNENCKSIIRLYQGEYRTGHVRERRIDRCQW